MDIVARLYSSYGSEKLLIPNGMIRMLQDKEKFSEYGYAFVLDICTEKMPVISFSL